MPRTKSITSDKELVVASEAQLMYVLSEKMGPDKQEILSPIAKTELDGPINTFSSRRRLPHRCQRWAMRQFDVVAMVKFLKEEDITQDFILAELLAIYKCDTTPLKTRMDILDRFRDMHMAAASMWPKAQKAIRDSIGVVVPGGEQSGAGPQDPIMASLKNAS